MALEKDFEEYIINKVRTLYFDEKHQELAIGFRIYNEDTGGRKWLLIKRIAISNTPYRFEVYISEDRDNLPLRHYQCVDHEQSLAKVTDRILAYLDEQLGE